MATLGRKKQKEYTELTVREALAKGDLFTKLSTVVMGLGNLVRGQIVKGIMFLALEIYFIIFMITTGVESIKGFITLGTRTAEEYFDEASQMYLMRAGDNSMLCLAFLTLSTIS